MLLPEQAEALQSEVSAAGRASAATLEVSQPSRDDVEHRYGVWCLRMGWGHRVGAWAIGEVMMRVKMQIRAVLDLPAAQDALRDVGLITEADVELVFVLPYLNTEIYCTDVAEAHAGAVAILRAYIGKRDEKPSIPAQETESPAP